MIGDSLGDWLQSPTRQGLLCINVVIELKIKVTSLGIIQAASYCTHIKDLSLEIVMINGCTQIITSDTSYRALAIGYDGIFEKLSE